ncbi:MAG: maltose alpha-D-glucosyltransferase [Chitinispirillaceae bacterium]|nr:maltose alpha-D-glucosyltransferase [Chitinispirillaceae bacterium]
MVSDDPLWYKDAVIYQVHVKSFFDSSGDGIGDFTGLAEKLGYLETLGVTAIWLLPFYPSPLKDDGYDIADYMDVHPAYGTLKDFKNFLRVAHDRGIRVITELVLNHTSNQHAWFRRARSAPPSSKWRDYYVWSDSPDRYRNARVIFKDFETSNWTWDPEARAYYWHRFYAHQPDLNFENPQVHRELIRVIDFWLDMGIDGLRLDAVPYLYEEEGTSCENLPRTYEFLRNLRRHVDQHFPNRMLLAEANQWPEDAAAYLGNGDICHMAFNFPLMPRIYIALQKEDWFPITDILEQTPRLPESAQWAIFLRNHDELTLEMVTDEERDYMYRHFANDPSARINLGIRRRLAPLVNNSRRRIELLNILLFSMRGTPIIYYGDEIGMGDNHYLGDRNGVRTPMQWSAERNAGFSRANPQRLYLPIIIDPEYHYETVNVENEEQNLSSLLWWMKRVITMRKNHPAFSRGDFEQVVSDNASVFAFTRTYGDEIILVVINLSRFCQSVRLGLNRFAGHEPRDVFSGNRFPSIGEGPYELTMGFHDYYWLRLHKPREQLRLDEGTEAPLIRLKEDWSQLFQGPRKLTVEAVLPAYLQRRKTCGCRPLPISEVRIGGHVMVEKEPFRAALLLLHIRYGSGAMDAILLPVSLAGKEHVNAVIGPNTNRVIARVAGGATDGILYDCSNDTALIALLFDVVARRRVLRNRRSPLFCAGVNNGRWSFPDQFDGVIRMIRAERYNTSFDWNDSLHLKLYRRLEVGTNPEVEILSHLVGSFANAPQYLGSLMLRVREGGTMTIGMLSVYIPNTGTAWSVAVDAAVKYLEHLLSLPPETAAVLPAQLPMAGSVDGAVAAEAERTLGMFAPVVSLIGRRTAEFHDALAGETDRSEFSPEPFTSYYQRSLYQSVRSRTRHTVARVRHELPKLSGIDREAAEWLAGNESAIINTYQIMLRQAFSIVKIRIHGDYRLEHLLMAGNDCFIKDLEGRQDLALSERRIKRSAMRDLSRIIHSCHTAAHTALYRGVKVQEKQIAPLRPWADYWFSCAATHLFATYSDTVTTPRLLPDSLEERRLLLRFYLMDNAVDDIAVRAFHGFSGISVSVDALKLYLEMGS